MQHSHYLKFHALGWLFIAWNFESRHTECSAAVADVESTAHDVLGTVSFARTEAARRVVQSCLLAWIVMGMAGSDRKEGHACLLA